MYSLLKKHISLLRVMFERSRQLQISLNVKKCIFAVPFGTLLGHIVCKDGVCVDPTKIAIIIHMEPPHNIRKLRETLGHMGYFRSLIRNYATIIAPMERLLKRMEEFIWTTDCQVALDKLKEMLVSAPILVYPDWNKMFHVHIDASRIALGAVLAQPGENMDHLVDYARKNLSMVEKNYTTTKREALAMVYSLQKFRHYLFGASFKFLTDHSTQKYLVNKLALEVRICRWLLLFQDFTFEVVVKLGILNVGSDHLSRLETRESDGAIDDQLPNVDLFRIEAIPNHL